MTPAVADLVAGLEPVEPRPPRSQLVCGDPAARVRRVLLAVDATPEIAAEAVGRGADLLLVRHADVLDGCTSIASTTPAGRVLHPLVRDGVALLAAPAAAGIEGCAVLADRLGLREVRPLLPEAMDLLVTAVPPDAADRVADALAAAGAGALSGYTRCAWTSSGVGTFRPGPLVTAVVGAPGELQRVPETRIEVIMRRRDRGAVLAALRAAHPYAEPAIHVTELAAATGGDGPGRVGVLPEACSVGAFAARVGSALAAVVRSTGPADRPVRTVAVYAGAGERLRAAAQGSGADVYVSGDLRDPRSGDTVALVDAGRWRVERPWLDAAASAVRALGVTAEIATADGDPWIHERISHPAA